MNDEPIPLEDEIYEEEIEVEEETSVTMAMWGEITGDIDNQTDLKEALDAKQNNLTQAQLDAVNSGINSTKVSTYDGYQAQINTKASQSALDAEAEARRQADSTLQGKIDAEETARKASDKDIQDVLDGETLARQNADTALGGRIDTEIHDRQVADIGLQGQIDAITSKSDVVDVVATYADLQAYDTQHLGDNDVIKVLDDETHGDALTYYRWSKTNQTWTFIGQEAPYYSKSQTDTLLLGKQNTIDSSHKLSADLVDDTSTTNKFVTASDITNWNGKQDALTAGTGIDITSGIISTPAIVPEVVTELPTTGAEGKLYLTPKAHTTQTATGNPIEATVTEQAGQLESFQLDGDTFQQSYTGKNLIAVTRTEPQTQNGVTCTWDGASFTLNGTSTADIDFYGRGWWGTTQYPIALPAGTYTLSMRKSDGSLATDANFSIDCYYGTTHIIGIYRGNSGAGYQTLTFDSDTQYSVLYLSLVSGKTYNNEKFYIQLEKSESHTTYEPYVGGQPSPNPSYPQPIQTVTGLQKIEVQGKNLFDKSSAERDKILLPNGTVGGYDILYATSDFIPVSPGQTYYKTQSLSVRFKYYNANKEPLDTTTYQDIPNANNAQSFVVPSNAYYIRLTVGVSYLDSLQIEPGSTATAYAPYSKQTLPINLGDIQLCGLGDDGNGNPLYQDYIYPDGNDWKVHKATVSAIIDGSESWGTSGTNTFYVANIYSKIGNSIQSARTGEMYASHFTIADVTSSNTLVGASLRTDAAHNVSNLSIRLQDMSGGVAGFRQMLSAKKPSIYARRLTPTDTTITDTNLIAQLEAIRTALLQNGANTITNTATGSNLAGDMEIGYFGFNPTNRYDKFIWLDLNNNYEQIGGE